jgi:hypothetical protein
MTIPIIGYPIEFGELHYTNPAGNRFYRGELWGGGFHVEFDYSLTNNLCSSLSISQELSRFLFNQPKFTANAWYTEILIGVNYKL